MKIVDAGFIIIQELPYRDMLDIIERAYRICYASEPKGDSEEFIKSKIKLGHLSPLEHCVISVEFTNDRGVSHEEVRHRLSSFCLSGDTEILRFKRATNRKNLTIRELYERQENGKSLSGRNKLMFLRSMNGEGKLVPNKFKKIIYSGIKDVYEVKTKLGYTIKSSLGHIFFNRNGEIKLKNLKGGDNIFVNGRPSLLDITDDELKCLYNETKMSPLEISKEFNVPYRTVLNKLHKIGAFQKHKNDNNKNKYNKNHTKKSYEKMKKTIKEQYDSGEREPWNKGLTKETNKSLKILSEKRKGQEHNYYLKGKIREQHHSWKGENISTISGRRLRFSKLEKKQCEMCNIKTKLENHHIDKNPENDSKDNKQTLCVKCHKLIHKGFNVLQVVEDSIVSIKYVGKEETYDIEMMPPHHNFVANGFVVHNSQQSTRFTNFSNDKFGNEISVINPREILDENEKLGDMMFPLPAFDHFSGKWNLVIDEEHSRNLSLNNYDRWQIACLYTEFFYMGMIENGAKPQAARSVLPNSLMTKLIMTCNIRQWREVMKQRAIGTTGKPHPQMLEVMVPLFEYFKEEYPAFFYDLNLKEEIKQ